MGKVLSGFRNGYPGAISRSVDDIVISLGNASGGDIAFGDALFLVSGTRTCTGFDADSSASAAFLGFAVRAADKTPDVYESSAGCYKANDPVDVLVRGSTVLEFDSAALPGASVYIRKADGKYVTAAGSEGTTVLLPNVTVRTSRDANRCAEVVIKNRNAM